MNNLLKLSVWLAVVSAAHTEETSSSSSSFASTIKTLLRGGDGEYLTTQKTNPCATRARPENCKWIWICNVSLRFVGMTTLMFHYSLSTARY